MELYRQFSQVKISSLGRLHAKVYLVDDEIGIITSANLTSGGLISNFEYGVLINNKDIVSTIKEDMSKYYSLGNILNENILKKLVMRQINYTKIRARAIKGLKLLNWEAY